MVWLELVGRLDDILLFVVEDEEFDVTEFERIVVIEEVESTPVVVIEVELVGGCGTVDDESGNVVVDIDALVVESNSFEVVVEVEELKNVEVECEGC